MSCCATDSPLLPPTEYRCVYRHRANTCCGVAHDVNYVEYFDCLLSLANKVENIDRGQVFAYPSLTPKVPFPRKDLSRHLLEGSLAHPSPHPSGISIGSGILARLTFVTNRQADRPRYSGNNRPHISLRIAMRPNNNNYNLADSILSEC